MNVDAHTPQLVIVGIDGSPTGQAALAWAAAEAAARGWTLAVLHSWQQPDQAMVALPGIYPARDSARQAEAAARTVLDEALGWLREHHPGLPVSTDLLHGPGGPRLAAHAREGDVLVLGMSTRHRVTARMLGSTVDHLLRHARCQLVVVPPAGAVPAEEHGPFSGQVVAAVRDPRDPGDVAEIATISAVLGVGFAAAALHQVPLEVVHADPRRPEAIGCIVGWATPVTPSTVRQPLNRAIDSWHAYHPHVTVHRVTISGPPSPVLSRITHGARLLVVGRSSHPMRPVRLIDHLLTAASCPVAVTPPMPLPAAHLTQEERSALRLPATTHPAWSTQ